MRKKEAKYTRFTIWPRSIRAMLLFYLSLEADTAIGDSFNLSKAFRFALSLMKSTSTSSLIASFESAIRTSFICLTAWDPTCIITSPTRIPASYAGPRVSTSTTKTPESAGRSYLRAIAWFMLAPDIPSHGRTTLPFSRICWTTHFIVLTGMAKPTPCANGIIAVSRIDSSVCLDQPFEDEIGAGQRPSEGAYHSHGNCWSALEPERVADGESYLSNLQFLRVP